MNAYLYIFSWLSIEEMSGFIFFVFYILCIHNCSILEIWMFCILNFYFVGYSSFWLNWAYHDWKIMPNGSVLSWRMNNVGWCLLNIIYQIWNNFFSEAILFSVLKFRFGTVINIKSSTYYIRWVTFMMLTEL